MYANTHANVLSDGSVTYDVIVNVDSDSKPIFGRLVRFECVTQEEAHELQDAINQCNAVYLEEK